MSEQASIGVWGLFTWAVRIFREHFRLICLITLAIMVPSNLIFAFLPAGADTSSFQESARFARLWLLLLNATFGLVAGIMYILLADNALQKKASAFGKLFHDALRRYPLVLLTSIVLGLCLIFAYFLLIIPGIYFSVAWSFTFAVAVLTGVHGWRAMDKSASLVKGRWMSTLGYYIAYFFIFLALMALAYLPEAALTWAEVQGYLPSFSDYRDLVTPGAWGVLVLHLVAAFPIDLLGALNIILGVVMFRVWESSAVK